MFALTIVRDVSEIKRIQQRLESIYDTVGDIIFLVAVEDDGVFRVESVNKHFATTTGLLAEAIDGTPVVDLKPVLDDLCDC